VLSGAALTRPDHLIQGGGYGRRLPLLDTALCDGYLQVDDEQAIKVARRLAKEEGVFAGFSTEANVAAALYLLESRLCQDCFRSLSRLDVPNLAGPHAEMVPKCRGERGWMTITNGLAHLVYRQMLLSQKA
jgi:hypothetical protein